MKSAINKYIYCSLLIAIFLTYSGSAQTVRRVSACKPTIMNKITFIPEEFNEIELGYYQNSMTPCTPGYPEDIMRTNNVYINIPEKVIYYRGADSLYPTIPLCGLYSISAKRSLKYYDLSSKIIHVKTTGGDDVIFTGEITEPYSPNKIVAPFSRITEEEKNIKIMEAQNYTDEELDDSQAFGNYININLLEYVDMPFRPGVYEVWISLRGLESNHCFVQIIDFESMETKMCPCSPNFPHELEDVTTLKINVPEKIIFHSLEEKFISVIPVCVGYCVSYLRELKYLNSSEKKIHIKHENGDVVYSGDYFDKDTVNKTPATSPEEDEYWQEKSNEVQTLSDDELDRAFYSGNILNVYSRGYLNVNALDYVEMTLMPGRYEIWVTFYGLESNHAFVEILMD